MSLSTCVYLTLTSDHLCSDDAYLKRLRADPRHQDFVARFRDYLQDIKEGQ